MERQCIVCGAAIDEGSELACAGCIGLVNDLHKASRMVKVICEEGGEDQGANPALVPLCLQDVRNRLVCIKALMDSRKA